MLKVGDLRRLIEGVADDKLVGLDWYGDPPDDYEPAVRLHGARRCTPDDIMACGIRRPADSDDGIELLVSLVSLDDLELDDDEDEDEEERCPNCGLADLEETLVSVDGKDDVPARLCRNCGHAVIESNKE